MATMRGKSETPSAPQTGRLQPRRAARRWLAGLAVVVAVAAGAGLLILGRTGEPDAAQQGPTQASAGQLSVPDIRLTAAAFDGGQPFVLSEQAHKPTIVFAMAAWCLTCIPEAKALVQLEREVGDRVNIVVLDIDPGDTEAMLQQFAKAVGGAPGVWALDKDSVVTRAYGIRSLDTTIVIAGGREVTRTFGPQSLDQLRTAVAKAEQAGQ